MSRRGRRGFTLVETLVSLFIIGVAVAAFLPASLNSRAMVMKNRHKELATSLASAIVEMKRDQGYSACPIGTWPLPPSVTQPDLPNFSGNVVFGYVTSGMAASGANTNRKRIDVTVSWDDKVRDKGSVTVSSIISNV